MLGERRRFGQQPTRRFLKQPKQLFDSSRVSYSYSNRRSSSDSDKGLSCLPKASSNDDWWDSYRPLKNPLGQSSALSENSRDSDSIMIVGFPPHHYKTVLDKFSKYGDIEDAFLFKNILQITYKNPMGHGLANEFVQRALLEDMKWIRPKNNDEPFVLGVAVYDGHSMDISMTCDEKRSVFFKTDQEAAADAARQGRGMPWKQSCLKRVQGRVTTCKKCCTKRVRRILPNNLNDILQYCLYLLKS